MLQKCILKSWDPNALECLCSLYFFLIFLDSWNPFTSIQFSYLQFLFWSFWSHLSSTGFPHSPLSCYLLLYIIFLVCHLSISLPRGQDDYIIKLNFNSSWILSAWGIWSPSNDLTHHSGHLITRGIMFPSFWHLCHLLHLLISWSNLITFLIWVCRTGIGTV